MEYGGDSNLRDFIDAHKNSGEYIKEKIIIDIIKQICLGLQAIHNGNIIHRDLKPENILFDDINKIDFKIKIGDFGISKKAPNTLTQIGTNFYIAPEIMQGKKYNNKVDIYSLGCIIYELFTFRQYNVDKLSNDIQEIDSDYYDSKWQELIDKLVDTIPENRPNIEKVLFDYFGWKE